MMRGTPYTGMAVQAYGTVVRACTGVIGHSNKDDDELVCFFCVLGSACALCRSELVCGMLTVCERQRPQLCPKNTGGNAEHERQKQVWSD